MQLRVGGAVQTEGEQDGSEVEVLDRLPLGLGHLHLVLVRPLPGLVRLPLGLVVLPPDPSDVVCISYLFWALYAILPISLHKLYPLLSWKNYFTKHVPCALNARFLKGWG